MLRTGAELVVDSLASAGVKYLFSVSGNQIMPVFDATIGRDLEIIHTRHEAAAVHMADGWGRLTERAGIALCTAGPGHLNTLSALYVALMAESPVLLLSGHAPLAQAGEGAFQEIDQVAAARPVTKAARVVRDADRLAEEIESALDVAQTGRPGPVHLSLPQDILEATVSSESSDARRTSNRAPGEGQHEEILNLLEQAERPLILAGPAMARPKRWIEVERLSRLTGIPCLPIHSPRGVNDPWLHGATNSLSQADLVLLVGKDLDFSLGFGQPPFFSKACRFLQIDAEKAPVRGKVAVRLHEDPCRALRRLIALAKARPWPSNPRRQAIEKARADVPAEWASLRLTSQAPIHPLRLCAELQPFFEDGAVFVSDGGEFGQWVQAGLEAEVRLINGPSGSIGSGLPMALAAKLVYPERPVFVFLGDGTFGYHGMEFDTAIRYGLPVICFVGNDARWNAEYQIQLRSYGADRLIGCELLPSRYDLVCQALGGHGECVQRAEELAAAVKRAIDAGRPACINVSIEGAGAPVFR